jgi:hypothetical protein
MNDLLSNISQVIIGIAMLLGIMIAPRQPEKVYRWLMLYMIITLINSLALTITGNMGIRNHFILNIYVYLRFPLIGLIYFEIYKWQRRRKFWLPILFWFITPVLLLYSLNMEGWNKAHTTYIIVGSAFAIVCILIYFYNMFAQENPGNPMNYPLFWTSIGLFFFFLLLMPTRGILNTLVSTNLLLGKQASLVLQAYNCILYSLISLDFLMVWKRYRKQQALTLL